MAAVTIHSEFGAQEEENCHYFHHFPLIHHSVRGMGTQHHPSAENWIKDLLSRVLQDSEQDLVCPTASTTYEEAFKSLLSLTIRYQIE